MNEKQGREQQIQTQTGPCMSTWKLMLMFLDVFEHVVVGVGDDESFAEYVDHRADVQVLRSIVGWRLGQTAWSCHTTPVQVFASDESGIANCRFVDGQSVIRQTVDENEATASFLLPRILLRLIIIMK